MVVGFIIGLIVNTLAFVGISMILPGFKIASQRTAVIVAVIYAVLAKLGFLFLTVPFTAITAILLIPIAFIPIIGPLFVAGSLFVSWFLIGFVVSVVTLIATDKILEDFEMTSMGTAVGAAAILGGINLAINFLPF